MKITSSELKKRARLTLSGNYGISAGAMLIWDVILVVIMLVYIGMMAGCSAFLFRRNLYVESGFIGLCITLLASYVVVVFLMYLLMCGICRMLFNMSTNRPFSLGDMLFAFTRKSYRFLGVYGIFLGFGLMTEIPCFVVSTVASITHYIPIMVVLEILMYVFQMVGRVAFFLYFGLANLLLVENPERKVISCFKESVALMKGSKGRMFYLCMSFIGMALLGVGSFGIGFLWVLPYMKTTFIHFYLDISGKTACELV